MSGMENDEGVSPALAAAIEERRVELGLTVTGLAKAAGVSLQGLAPLRAGKIRNYQERLTGPVCRALNWTPDSIDRILAGDPPVESSPSLNGTLSHPAATVDADELLARIRVELAEHERRIAEMVAGLMEGGNNERASRQRGSIESTGGAPAPRATADSD